MDLLELLIVAIATEDSSTAESVLVYILDQVKPEFDSKFSTYGKIDCGFLMLFAHTPTLAKMFVKYNFPRDANNGRAYGETLLGELEAAF